MAGALAALAAFDRLAPHIGNSPATAVQIAGLALISIPLATLVPLALAPAAGLGARLLLLGGAGGAGHGAADLDRLLGYAGHAGQAGGGQR